MAVEALSGAPHAEVLRRLYSTVLARTLRLTRALPDAEDAVQEAVARALESWPTRGMPDAPEAWLVTVAANAHRDRLRRTWREDLRGDGLESLAELSPWLESAMRSPGVTRGFDDELLRLLFACCHPALGPGEGAALALATVVGLSTNEIAHAFLVAHRSMEQRLARARRRLRARGDCEGTSLEESRERTPGVLQAIHLLFNEGYWSTSDAAPLRQELCVLALGLAHSLAAAFPDEPEALGLLALLTLHGARHAARLGTAGEPVPLPEQDRSRWDRGAIERGVALLEQALALGRPGPFQVEAAISALHCRAEAAVDTDWEEIAALYAALEHLRPTPAVRVNRAFAVARAAGANAGLALLEARDVDAASYPYVHLVRGALLEELGRYDDAREALELAAAHARNARERAQIRSRLERIP